jgi:iron complex transport system permease protein
MQKTNTLLIFTATFVLLPVVFGICLCFGTVFISPQEYICANPEISNIVWLRFCRLLSGFVVGGSLAVSGAAYQAILRNPLAEPFILGISGGASLGAAIAIALGFTAISFLFLPFFSFITALIVLSLVLLIARGTGSEYANNVMLSGVIAGTLCSSMLMFIISVLDSHKLNSITWWMLGNLEQGNMAFLKVAGITVIAVTVILYFYGREINALTLGDEMAFYLGINSKALTLVILGLSSLLAASAVALSGIIGFVGLVVPHILRRLFGSDHRRLFPLSLLYGGMFLMVCDTFAKTVLSPREIPVGVITSLVGGPFFIWLLNRKSNKIQGL